MMVTILADIGGTHARLALQGEDGPLHAEKLRAADYPDFAAAIAAYCAGQGVDAKGRIAIATAAHPDAHGIWHFQNRNEWAIDPRALTGAGWETALIVNDFAASALGAVLTPDEDLITLRGGQPLARAQVEPRYAVLGPGTGLGLGFVARVHGRWHVQETLGGHMFGACATDEQYMVSKIVRRLRGGEMMFIPEDVCSGVGLPILYHAVCLMHGAAPQYDDAAGVVMHRLDDPMARDAMRLFHEFLGLFAHNALVTGHGFGGLYLDGGLAQQLWAREAFDTDTFLRFMTLRAADVVDEHIAATPVRLINDTFVALRGLSQMVRDSGQGAA